MNDAILNKTSLLLKDCTIYTLKFSYNESVKLIVESGIEEIVYYSVKFNENLIMQASKIILKRGRVKLKNFIPEKEENRSTWNICKKAC